MLKVKALIEPVDPAVTDTSVVIGTSGALSPVTSTFWSIAVVILVILFLAAAAPTAIATVPSSEEHGKDQNGTDQEAALRALLQRPEVLNLLSQKDGK